MRKRTLLLSCAALLLQSARADAQLFLGGAGAPFARVGVRSWVQIPFRSTVRQQFDFSCGSAAVATLLSFQYDRPTSEADVFKAMWDVGDQDTIRVKGFSLLDMKSYLRRLGFQAAGMRMEVADLRDLNLPVIALVTIRGYAHFVVVKGAQDGKVLLGDPMRGLVTMDDSAFAKIWGGIALVVTKPPAGVTPQFNAAADWQPWATAPTGRVWVRTAGFTTDNLPPIYQVQRQLLPLIPVGLK